MWTVPLRIYIWRCHLYSLNSREELIFHGRFITRTSMLVNTKIMLTRAIFGRMNFIWQFLDLNTQAKGLLSRLRTISLSRIIFTSLWSTFDSLLLRSPKRCLYFISERLKWVLFNFFFFIIFGCHFVFMYTFSDYVIILPEVIFIFLDYRCLDT